MGASKPGIPKLRNRRLVLDFEATTDARLLLPGARIDVVDDTRFKRYGGEVVGQSGLELTLSQPVEFTAGQSHSIILMRRDGTTQSIACTAGSRSNKVILSGLPAEDLVTEYSESGIRTIYSFAADSVRDSQSWLVQEIVAKTLTTYRFGRLITPKTTTHTTTANCRIKTPSLTDRPKPVFMSMIQGIL